MQYYLKANHVKGDKACSIMTQAGSILDMHSRDHEGKRSSSQVTRNKTMNAATDIWSLLEIFVHLDSDGVQAVGDLLQLRVAFTNLLNKRKKNAIVVLWRKYVKKDKNQKANTY